MDAETLYHVVNVINEEISQKRIPNGIDILRTHLQNANGNPGDQSHLQNFNDEYKKLMKLLTDSPTNYFLPSEISSVEALGAKHMVGLGLLDRIDGALGGEKPPFKKSALIRLQELLTELNAFHSKIQSTKTALDSLQLKLTATDDSFGEIGLHIPAGEMTLVEAGKTLSNYGKHLALLSEASGQKDPQLASLSVGSLDVFLTGGVDLIKALANVVHLAATLCVDLAQLRMAIQSIKAFGKESEHFSGAASSIKSGEEEMIKARVQAYAKEFLDNHYTNEDERKNELQKAVGDAVGYLVKELDRGLRIEVTLGRPTAGGDRIAGVTIEQDLRTIMSKLESLQREIPALTHSSAAPAENEGNETKEEN